MEELKNINNNTNGQLPKGEKTVITVVDIDNPEKVLNNCKDAVTALLQNISLNGDDPEWRTLLPEVYIQFLDKLDLQDKGLDNNIYFLGSLIRNFQKKNINKWKWYSSKINENSFVIVTEGLFSPRFAWLIHYQNIPYTKIWIDDGNGEKYTIKVIKDVTTYKKFN